MATTPHSPNTRSSASRRGAAAASGRRADARERVGRRAPFAAQGSRGIRPSNSGAPNGGPRKRPGQRPGKKPSIRQRRIYLRRRIIAAATAALALVLVVFCVYSLGRGAYAVVNVIRHDDVTALVRRSIPNSVRESSGVQNCTARDVQLELSTQSQTVPVAGSLEFTMTVAYDGTNSCLIDVSDTSRVLTITSGSDTIWKSDVCPAKPHMLLMSKGDRRVDTLIWNTDSTGSACAADASLPKVRPGTYVATLSLKNDANAVSKPVTVTVK